MRRANASLQAARRPASFFSPEQSQLVGAGAGAPASGQSTKAADIPRPGSPSPARPAFGLCSLAVQPARSAAEHQPSEVRRRHCSKLVPSPAALAVENVSQSVEAAGLPAAAPGTSISARPFARPRSLLSRVSTTEVLRAVLPNRFIERTKNGVPFLAAHVGR